MCWKNNCHDSQIYGDFRQFDRLRAKLLETKYFAKYNCEISLKKHMRNERQTRSHKLWHKSIVSSLSICNECFVQRRGNGWEWVIRHALSPKCLSLCHQYIFCRFFRSDILAIYFRFRSQFVCGFCWNRDNFGGIWFFPKIILENRLIKTQKIVVFANN